MWKQFFHKSTLRLRWLFALLMPLYVIAFSILLEPLKGEIVHYNYPIDDVIIFYLAFIVLTIFYCLALPCLIPKYFHSENFTLIRFFTWFFLMCFSGCIISYYFDRQYHEIGHTAEWADLYWKEYMFPLSLFLLSNILAFFFMYKPKEIKLSDQKESLIFESIEPSAPISPVTITASSSSPILQFQDSSGKNTFELKLENIYYITSANNYIEVFYKKEDYPVNNVVENFTPTRLLLRNTLKTVEEQNAHIPELYRCHKAYIVNKQKVLNVKGNTKGYSLTLQDIPLEIPVSRHKNSEIERLFTVK